MLDFQVIKAPFRFGVDEGVDPKQVPIGTLLTAENVCWIKSGRLQKRNGTTTLTQSIVGGGSISSARRLFTRGDELAMTDGTKLYGYTSSGWVDRDRLPEIGLTWETTNDSIAGVRAADVAYLSSGLVVHAWVSSDPAFSSLSGGDVYYQVTDRLTGGIVTAPTAITSGAAASRVRIVVTGTEYAIVWTTGGNIRSFCAGTTTTLKTDVDNDSRLEQAFDACVIGSLFVIAYVISSGGIRLVSYTFAATPVQQATDTVTGLSSMSIQAVSIDGASGEVLYVGYFDRTNNIIRSAIHNSSTLAQTVSPATLTTVSGPGWMTLGVARTSSTTSVFAYSFSESGSSAEHDGALYSVRVDSNNTSYTVRKTAFTRLLSRPFTIGSRQYAVVANFVTCNGILTTAAQPPFAVDGADAYLIDITADTGAVTTPNRLVGKIELLTSGEWYPGHVSNAAAISSTEFLVASPFTGEIGSASESNGIAIRQGFRTVTVTSGASLPNDMWRSVSIGPETYAAAGVLTAYDGQLATSYGFAHPAFLDNASAAGSIGGLMATGTYTFNVVPERRSAAGILHRGPTAVAQPYSVTGPQGKVVLRIVPIHLSICGQTTHLAIYRTIVDGSELYRLTVEPRYDYLPNTYSPPGPFTLDTSYKDSAIGGTGDGAGNNGVDLSTRPLIYTDGGELDDFQPPAFTTICLYRGRIFGIGGDQSTLWFSKAHTDNPGVAPGFYPDFRVVLNDTLTALAVLDERLIIFSETGIYTMYGDGPAVDGTGSDFGTPNKLQTDVGCTVPRGVVSGPEGVFFVSGNEIHMLTRGMEVDWVGKRVQDQLDAFPVITSAVLVPKKNQVRFSCQASNGLTGVVLAFDYVENQWACYKYGASVPIADACLHGGVYTFVTTGGLVYKESEATYLDNGSYVVSKIETAWIHASGPTEYQSVRNFRIDGVSSTAHGLSISVGFNGESTYQQGPESWAEGVSGVTTPADSVTANISIGTRRKCRSIRFKVQDSAPVSLGTGQGPKWSSMGIEIGVKRGLGPLPQRQKG